MTKKSRAPTLRHHLCVALQLILTLSILAAILAFLRIHANNPTNYQTALDFEEEDQQPFLGGPHKIAFLFLARDRLPLELIWHAFFSNAGEELFSVYVHSRPGFVLDESNTKSVFFRGRQIERSVQVGWGEASMIEAERLLFAAALEDRANQRFVLLSESCVPLHNFSYTYSYLMASPKSFVDSFHDIKKTRYNPKMYPTISQDRWRKGSQWITLIRKHALVVVADDVIFPVFKRHCKRRPDLNLEGKLNMWGKPVVQKEHNCIPDEHYVQTLLSMAKLENELEKRTLTYTSWNQSNNEKGKQGWHPVTFEYANASPQQIQAIKDINHVDYETNFRTEWCQCNSTYVPCFLFARKFSRGAATRVLTEGFVGPFDAASLM